MLCTLGRPCPQEFRCHSQVLFEQPRGVKASLDDMSEALGPLLLGSVLLPSLLLPPGSSGHGTRGQRPCLHSSPGTERRAQPRFLWKAAE